MVYTPHGFLLDLVGISLAITWFLLGLAIHHLASRVDLMGNVGKSVSARGIHRPTTPLLEAVILDVQSVYFAQVIANPPRQFPARQQRCNAHSSSNWAGHRKLEIEDWRLDIGRWGPA